MESVTDTNDPPPLVTRTIGQIVSESESVVKGAKLVKKFHNKVEKVIILRVTDSTISRIVSVEYTGKNKDVQAGDNKGSLQKKHFFDICQNGRGGFVNI